MKAVWYEKSGAAADVLKTGEREKPVAGAGEVLIRMFASAVNPSDVKKRAGAQPAGFENGFVIPHSDGAGIIEAVGAGVAQSRIGERVWIYQAQFGRNCGTAAQYLAIPSDLAAPLPENTPFDIGACIGIPVMTAHRCVYNVDNLEGKNVLVTGASGRVGYYAAQWAKLAGAKVIATAGSESRCRIAEQTGAAEVLNYKEENLVEKIGEITSGKGIDHIVDVEFGMNARISAEIINNCGTISTYSSSLRPEPELPFYPMMFKNVTLDMVLVYNMPDAAKSQAINDIYTALDRGSLRHRIAESWPMEKTACAHQSIEAGGLDGCVVVEIDS